MDAPHSVSGNPLGNELVVLLERYKKLKAENAQLRDEMSSLQDELEKSNAEVVKLKANYERLKIARVYGWDEKNKRMATDKISKLVRDIDKCLDELNDLEL